MAARKKRAQVSESAFDEVPACHDGELQAAMDDYDARADLIAELVRYRRANGLKQQQVADAMGTTQSFVSDFENGRTDPHLSTYQRYARAVGVQLTTAVTRSAESVVDIFPAPPGAMSSSSARGLWMSVVESTSRATRNSRRNLQPAAWSRTAGRSDYGLAG